MFLASLLILFSQSVAQAEQFEAYACEIAPGYNGVQILGQRPCKALTFDNVVAFEDFANLEDGDYLVFTGEVVGNKLIMESVDSVGLNRVLGTWKDARSRYWDFSDYVTLDLYDPKKPLNSRYEEMSYELFPYARHKWHILLVSAQTNKVTVGDLRQFTTQNGDIRLELCLTVEKKKRDCSLLTRLSN